MRETCKAIIQGNNQCGIVQVLSLLGLKPIPHTSLLCSVSWCVDPYRWHFQGSFVNLLLYGFELWKLLVRYQRTGRWSHDTLLLPSWCSWHQLPFVEACCGSRFLSVSLTFGFQFWLPLHFPWPYCPVTVANSCLCSFLDCFTIPCWPLRDFLWAMLDSFCFGYSELFLFSCLGSD